MSKKLDSSKTDLAKFHTSELKDQVEKEAWIALRRFFDGCGNGQEARVACVVIATLTREQQAKNNARQLALLERRFLLDQPHEIVSLQEVKKVR